MNALTPIPPFGPSISTKRFWCLVSALALYLLCFHHGLRERMHRILPHASTRHSVCIAIAISDLKFGLNQGYMAYRKIVDALEENGMTPSDDIARRCGSTHPENLFDGDLMDRCIQTALAVEAPASYPRPLVPLYAEDLGYADFCKLGFLLFGYRLSSLYFAFFVLLGAAVLLYVLEFHRQPRALLLLSLVLGSLYLTMRALPFLDPEPLWNVQLRTVINGRFMAVLGVIPLFHVGLVLLERKRARWPRLTLVVLQLVLLMFVITCRSSALWCVLVLASIAAWRTLLWAWRRRRLWRELTLDEVWRDFRGAWPACLLCLAYLALGAYQARSQHWIYQTDEAQPHHFVWHNAYVGLKYHPDWDRDWAAYHDHKDWDEIPYVAIRKDLQSQGFDPNMVLTRDGAAYRPRFWDKLAKQVYLRFARQNPRYMAELLFYHKPRGIGVVYAHYVKAALRHMRPSTAAALGLVLLTFVVLLVASTAWKEHLRLQGLVSLATAASLLPVLWAYPSKLVFGDQALMISVFLACTASFALKSGYCLMRRLSSSGNESGVPNLAETPRAAA
jgi:hypothetical protein